MTVFLFLASESVKCTSIWHDARDWVGSDETKNLLNFLTSSILDEFLWNNEPVAAAYAVKSAIAFVAMTLFQATTVIAEIVAKLRGVERQQSSRYLQRKLNSQVNRKYSKLQAPTAAASLVDFVNIAGRN